MHAVDSGLKFATLLAGLCGCGEQQQLAEPCPGSDGDVTNGGAGHVGAGLPAAAVASLRQGEGSPVQGGRHRERLRPHGNEGIISLSILQWFSLDFRLAQTDLWLYVEMELHHLWAQLQHLELAVGFGLYILVMQDEARRELLQMAETEINDIARVCNRYPDIHLEHKILGTENEPIPAKDFKEPVPANSSVAMQIELTREQAGDLRPVDAPRYSTDPIPQALIWA